MAAPIIPSAVPDAGAGVTSPTTVYVTSISNLIGEEHVNDLFGTCGTIKSFELSKDTDGKKKAVITYAEPSMATAAVVTRHSPQRASNVSKVSILFGYSGALRHDAR